MLRYELLLSCGGCYHSGGVIIVVCVGFVCGGIVVLICFGRGRSIGCLFVGFFVVLLCWGGSMVMLSNVVGILVGRRVSGGWTVCLCVVLCHSVDESCELGIVGCHDAWSGAVGVVA